MPPPTGEQILEHSESESAPQTTTANNPSPWSTPVTQRRREPDQNPPAARCQETRNHAARSPQPHTPCDSQDPVANTPDATPQPDPTTSGSTAPNQSAPRSPSPASSDTPPTTPESAAPPHPQSTPPAAANTSAAPPRPTPPSPCSSNTPTPERSP